MTDDQIFYLCEYVAKELKNIRLKQHKLLEDVAYDLGVSASYVGSIENGKRTKLSLFMYIKYADNLGVPFEKVVANARAKMYLDSDLFE